jgi:uncharacterized protein involved in outer membrane biogenesis
LIVGAVVTLTLTLDRVIQKGVETVGTRVAKVEVKLAGVSVSMLSGSGSIKGLSVGNPEGYKTPTAIAVGSSSIAIEPGSVLSDKAIVRSIRIEAPEIAFEVGPGGSNLQRIKANLPGGPASDESAPAVESKPGKKLQVDEVVITGGKVVLAAAILGGKLTEAPLPEIRLTNLGQGPEGITPGDLGARVLTAIMEGAIQVSGDALAKAG